MAEDSLVSGLRKRLVESTAADEPEATNKPPNRIPEEARKFLYRAQSCVGLIAKIHRILSVAYSPEELRWLVTLESLCEELEIDPATPMDSLPPKLIRRANLKVLDRHRRTGKAKKSTPKPTGKRIRATQSETKLKVYAAMFFKLHCPEANETKVAEEAKIPRSTLRQSKDWLEWVPKVEEGARKGKLAALTAVWDGRVGEFAACHDGREG